MKNFIATIITLIPISLNSQIAWTWTELDTMPMRISNNAVCAASISGESFIYSFGGIDSTKLFSGITDRAFRYEVNTDTWIEILPLPVALPLIASSASNVKNKIYIIGGYHVYSNGDESSSNEVIIYDPITNSYEPNGTPIPVPIDDQTQCVYKDSLIYVISGWSNTGNVVNVQIYDPALDQWSVGTSVPNNTSYKVFGSSGYIVGDTIFYYGGASTGLNFPAQKKLRKGVINASDPTQINWILEEDAPLTNYRSACVQHDTKVFWIGGSAVSYNYNGIAYNGSGGVEPLSQIMQYDSYTQTWYENTSTPYSVMDLRGAGQVSPISWIICGGMETNQSVSNRTFLLTYDPIVGGTIEKNPKEMIYNNGTILLKENAIGFEIYSMDGKLVYSLSENSDAFILPFEIKGNCIISVLFEDGAKRSMRIYISE